ncbi:MAG TPA: hypothetical protein VE075_09890 [Thermoanaerobaculia bacterium]|nr:hypothetical protein [Thermoanaerobaculia bacterium]
MLYRLAVIEGAVLFAGFFGLVVYKMAVGEIPLERLLDAKQPDGRQAFSPARLQMLIFTLVVAGWYLHQVMVSKDRSSLPDLPQSVVGALGGSHAVYLGGKVMSAVVQPAMKRFR